MYNNLYQLIKENESNGDFSYATVTDNMLSTAEDQLGLKTPNGYKWFLKTFGHGGIGGIEVLGFGKNGKAIFVDETIKYRIYGLPKDVILIENCDEWVYCIQSQSGKVGMWSPGNSACKNIYDNFETYLQDRIGDILENRE